MQFYHLLHKRVYFPEHVVTHRIAHSIYYLPFNLCYCTLIKRAHHRRMTWFLTEPCYTTLERTQRYLLNLYNLTCLSKKCAHILLNKKDGIEV